jgi:upstream activation factor subunit UAF30
MSNHNSDSTKDVSHIQSQFQDLLLNLSSFKSHLTMLSNQVKSLEKNVRKEMKKLQKEALKNKNKGNRKASGFAVPTKISKDLCKFMNQPDGTEMARTEVTKYIIQYIKDHNLPDKENKKVIKPDKRLKSLLKLQKNDEVTYFNLQKYMNKHFISNKSSSKN